MTVETAAPGTIDIGRILGYLPHRFPFLLVDRVLTVQPGKSLTALKNVSINEPFFQGHFPQRPILPGVLIIEAMAQATGILAFITDQRRADDGIMYYLAGIDNARFKRPVVPGDQLHIEVTMQRSRRGIAVFHGQAKVAEKMVASADLTCAQQSVGS